MKSTLVLIPARNEADRIRPVIDGVRTQLPEARILVVNDGSEDDTGAIASRHGAITINHPFNLGYGAALHTGYHYAKKHGYDQVIQLDADGQHDPASIQALLDTLAQGADVVVGSRYSGTAPRTSWLRRGASKMFAILVTTWTGVRITDPTSGFQAVSRRALDELVLDHFPEDYPDADVLIMLSRRGLDLREVPVTMHPRSGGKSMHRGGRAAYYAYKMFLTLSLLPVRRASHYRSGRRLAAPIT